MTQQEIDNFRWLAPLMLPDLIDFDRLDSVDDYDDYALLTFSLAEPRDIERIMDNMEDQMELNILYHSVTMSAGSTSHHCCAYAAPVNGHMYKFNVQTNADGKADTVYVYIFSSLEVMLESLKDDIMQHSASSHFITKMPFPRFIADFM